jgi:hypothetical protein
MRSEFYPGMPGILLALLPVAACSSGRDPTVSIQDTGHPFVERIANRPGMAWRVDTTDHFVVRGVADSYAGDNLGALAEAAERARDFVLRQLGESELREEARAHVFLVRGRDDMRELVGRPAGGWAEPDANAVLSAVADSVPPPLRHELGHLYSHRLWGPPHARWLSEGVAVYAAGHCAGIPLHSWAAAIQRTGDAASLDVLERGFDVARAAPHLLAGSFVAFVAQTHGVAAVRTLWREGLASARQATGASAAALESAWLDHLQGVVLPRDMPDHGGRVHCEDGTG